MPKNNTTLKNECKTKFKRDNTILNKCQKVLTKIKLGSKLGEGAYGKVYKATALEGLNEISVAIKIADVKSENLEDISTEIKYAKYMSDVNIGPKIYDSFYIKKLDIYKHYIIMEPFSLNCHDALQENIPKKSKLKIINSMISLLRKQIFKYKLYCSDIKPANYVCNLEPKISVKMIDFGSDLCFYDDIFKNSDVPNNIRSEIFYLLELLQLYLFVRELCPDLLASFSKDALWSKRSEFKEILIESMNIKGIHIKYYHMEKIEFTAFKKDVSEILDGS